MRRSQRRLAPRELTTLGHRVRLPKTVQGWEELAGVRALSIVRIDFGIGDHALAIYNVARWHRDGPARISVDDREISLERPIKVLKVTWQGYSDSERMSDLRALIDENRKRKFVFAL